MSLFHEPWQRRVSLLAAGVLEDSERQATIAHLADCGECREDSARITALLEAVATDGVRRAEPTVPLEFLVARVRERLKRPSRPHVAAWAWGAAAAGGAAIVVALLLPLRVTPVVTRTAAMDDTALRRVERTVSREQAVQFLNDAQDVLATMAAAPRDCDHEKARVDVGDEARRSREILTRRTLLVELDQDEVASARPVLEDVEHVLREVASLQACAHAGDVEQVRRQVRRQGLLMKIRLMSRELQG